jgi:hypothetical protein
MDSIQGKGKGVWLRLPSSSSLAIKRRGALLLGSLGALFLSTAMYQSYVAIQLEKEVSKVFRRTRINPYIVQGISLTDKIERSNEGRDPITSISNKMRIEARCDFIIISQSP